MTDNGQATMAEAALEPLPTLVHVPEEEISSLGRRIPSGEMFDRLEQVGAPSFDELMGTSRGKSRYLAFRVLSARYPLRDATSLWLHAHFVEVEADPPNPGGGEPLTSLPPSVGTGGAFRSTSTG
jgi:hypothetical protein